MNIQEAITKAQKEKKKIALPSNKQCENNGYLIKAIPYPNNLVVIEFYGLKRKFNHFSLPPNKITRNDWLVVD